MTSLVRAVLCDDILAAGRQKGPYNKIWKFESHAYFISM